MNPEKKSPEQKDVHLDTPGEANRDKHINFLAEEESTPPTVQIDLQQNSDEERRKQWEKEIEEGKKLRDDTTR